jgi:hypothetical protein
VTQTEEIDKAVKDERKHDGSELEGMNEGTRKKRKRKRTAGGQPEVTHLRTWKKKSSSFKTVCNVAI